VDSHKRPRGLAISLPASGNSLNARRRTRCGWSTSTAGSSNRNLPSVSSVLQTMLARPRKAQLRWTGFALGTEIPLRYAPRLDWSVFLGVLTGGLFRTHWHPLC